jgi:hypothetical protein
VRALDPQRAVSARAPRRSRSRLAAVLWILVGAVAMLGSARCLHAQPPPTPAYGWGNVTVQAPFAPRDGAGMVVYQNKLWLLGGWNADTTVFPNTTSNEVWSSPDGKHWTQVKRNTFGTSAFNPATDWEGRHMAGWAVFQNKLWIVGGDSNQCHYQPNVWNSSDGAHWTEVASDVPWGNRVLFYTLVFNNKLWVMGGQTLQLDDCPGPVLPTQTYNDVWTSSNGSSWTEVKASSVDASRFCFFCDRAATDYSWTPRGVICGAVVFNGRMWLIGGGVYGTPTTPDVLYNDVWSSADGMSWTRAVNHAPWNPRIYHDITVYDGKIWVIGGNAGNGGGNLNDVWYSSDGVNWKQLPNTPWLARHAASVAVLNSTLWMTGGTAYSGSQNDVWMLRNNGGIVPLINSLLLQ